MIDIEQTISPRQSMCNERTFALPTKTVVNVGEQATPTAIMATEYRQPLEGRKERLAIDGDRARNPRSTNWFAGPPYTPYTPAR